MKHKKRIRRQQIRAMDWEKKIMPNVRGTKWEKGYKRPGSYSRG